MRKDECLICGSRRCHTRIYTDDLTYDEVACSKHISMLEKNADIRKPGVMKTHLTSTGLLKRGGEKP